MCKLNLRSGSLSLWRPMHFVASASAGALCLMERLWFKLWKQPRPVLLHEVPEFVGHQLGVNICPFDKAADARQLLWRKIIVSTHGADDSRTRLGFSQLLGGGVGFGRRPLCLWHRHGNPEVLAFFITGS